MIRSMSTFLTDLRQDPRYRLRLPCRLDLASRGIAATMVEVSLGGARVELPPDTVTFLPGALRAVQIEPVGLLKAQERWRRGELIGLRFRGRDARLRIAAWFDDLGLRSGDTGWISPDG
ncbi:PilZ domain-containing protein [Seohaeicola zhoushanensis]|uniref:PilZ domain-containing protein n=1 Tax=Seohaeicola zhoushanensis TaxID=1569283 RepID=A0A8J3GX52_9RHOB|nr:PilZ domain-containing protein [Seohaeicola zhoushanensis]GHF47255.1 hypothetical protein GCM10017056_18730 [Seohaeicola zhoushanensis]